MAENPNKKDEEKLEFTPEGEVLGYISLDQARVLAMEHARDNREFYGRRYARRDLVWEVAAQEGPLQQVRTWVYQLDGIDPRAIAASGFDLAVVDAARAMAGTVIDLLADGARLGRKIVADFSPPMTKPEYLKLMRGLYETQVYTE